MTRVLALALVLSAVGALAAERVAVVIGANVGAPRRAKLWFAERDAERVARTFVELGDFDADKVQVLKQPNTAEVRGALAAAEVKLQQSRREGQRTVLVVYFSGHAASGALELGSERFEFQELKALVEASSADVKVAIVDACESGVLTQVKGAKATSAVDFVVPTEDSARGVAYIASTAVGEAAQESAAIGGSFFTFHLDTALRGAGDSNGDGLVSLAEAFQYTSSRTISGTSTTELGPQHPTYDFRMAGRGDVTLSDLRRAEATLVLRGEASSTWLVQQNKRLVAEAPGGQALALPAGTYRVERRSGTDVFAGDVTLAMGQRVEVGELPRVVALAGRGKGGDDGGRVELMVGGAAGTPLLARSTAVLGARVGARVGLGAWGVRLLVGYERASGTALSGASWQTQAIDVTGALVRRLVDSTVVLDVGLAAGTQSTWQALPSTTLNAWSGTGTATATFGVRVGPVVPQVMAWGGAQVLRVDDLLQARPLFGVALLVGVEL